MANEQALADQMRTTPQIVLDLWNYNAPNSGTNKGAELPTQAGDLIVELLGALEMAAKALEMEEGRFPALDEAERVIAKVRGPERAP